jgi:3D (Asp-Asp-Asp) domain-containing protein
MKKFEWVFALILTLTVVLMVYLESQTYKGESIPSNKETAILTLTARIDKISKQNVEYQNQIDALAQQINALAQQINTIQTQHKPDRGGERGCMMEVTAYWEGSCGKSPNDPDYGITASGEYVQDGFVAAGPEYPIGTRLYIPYFDRIFTIMDRGGMIGNGQLDVYMEDYASCMEFGRRELEVWVMQ